MKFAKYLEAELVPEWRTKYINYKTMKKVVKEVARVFQSMEEHSRIERAKIGPLQSSLPPRTESLADTVVTAEQTIPKPSKSPTIIDIPDGNLLAYRSGESGQKKELENSAILEGFKSNFDFRKGLGTEAERKFFVILDQEVEKVNLFYKQRQEDAISRFEALRTQLQLFKQRMLTHQQQQQTSPGGAEGVSSPSSKSYASAMKKLRASLLEFYRLLELIQNYRLLNYTAVAKILKKFDKAAGWKSSESYLKLVDDMEFQQSTVIKELMRDSELWYTELFAENKRSEAMKDLRVPDLKKNTHHFTLFRVGMYVGLSFPALIAVIVKLLREGVLDNYLYGRMVSIFAGFSTPVIFMFLFAFNLWVWNRKNVNYKFIFEFDPRDNLSYLQFFEFSGMLFFFWTYSAYLTFMDPFFGADAELKRYYPLIFFSIFVSVLVLPHPWLYWSSRRWMMVTTYRIIVSPYYKVQFRDFFVADEFNSFIYLLSSLQLFTCVYANNFTNLDEKCEVSQSFVSPAVNMAPAFWRLLQCCRQFRDSGFQTKRHIVNAGKYACIISVAWFSTWYNIFPGPAAMFFWVLSSTAATIYGYTWDVVFDWGCFQKNSKNRFLRDEITYPKWFYYFALCSNLVFRISWVLLVSVGFWGFGGTKGIVVYLIAIIELLRRFQWNFLRMENEHTNNVGEFRVVRDIPLPFHDDHDELSVSPRNHAIVSGNSDARTPSPKP